MILATLLLMLSVPQTGDATKPVTEPPAPVSADSAKAYSTSEQLPSVPTPKVEANVTEARDLATVSSNPSAPVGAIGPHNGPLPLEVVKRPRETPAQRKIWYALAATGHGAAAFDAWSTRRAVSRGYSEGNPFLAPFANSSAIYAATQVSPIVMDYLGKRMMVSQNRWIRRIWWLPQAAGTGFSIFAGVHNVGVVH
jgi:hypothetical protein